MALSSTAHLVIAEDDVFVQQLLAAHLEDAGYRVTAVESGRELLERLDDEGADLVLLDLGLPDEDGLVLVRRIRTRSDLPIVVLTARQEQESRLGALDLGADDYLTKPCDPRELLLRVQNLLRRTMKVPGAGSRRAGRDRLEFEGWKLDIPGRSLRSPAGEDIHLPRTEFNLLVALARSRNRVLSRDQLLDAITQHDSAPSQRMVDVLIARLRRKIEPDPRRPRIIRTVVGAGYKFAA